MRRRLADERARAQELVEEFGVSCSSVLSSVQRPDGHMVVAFGTAKVSGEYDEDCTLLARCTIGTDELLVDRVLQHTCADFWFSGMGW